MEGKVPADIVDFQPYKIRWAEELQLLRQNTLLSESSFLSFARDRGIDAQGVISGDPFDFYKRGWLSSDGEDEEGLPLFHPFRLYPLHRILEACELHIAKSSTIRREAFLDFITRILPGLPSLEEIGAASARWNRVIDLVVLLEPIYWPVVTGWTSHSGRLTETENDERREQYGHEVAALVASLDPSYWKKVHEELRRYAARLDDTDSLYLLLRLSNWNSREKLKGDISSALWIRHIAEVLRRAFEASAKEEWPEEDQASSFWSMGGRTNFYGSERPLQDVLKSRPYIALHFGLFTGSTVRWYVEGDTEYNAIVSVLPLPGKSGIELVNLRGNLERENGNIAMKLSDGLAQDRELRRFSMISFDTDVRANVARIRRLVDKNAIVGFIAAHDPDFEFSNFTRDELVEIAAHFDESLGFPGAVIREGTWTGIEGSKEFEVQYQRLSERGAKGLKGAEWGRALADYACEHPRSAGQVEDRPFWLEISAALRSRIANYDFQKAHFGFDRATFKAIKKQQKG